MPRILRNLLNAIAGRRALVRMLRTAEQAGMVNPDAEPVPLLLRGNAVYQVPVAYRVGDRSGHSTVRLAVHPSTPRSAIIAAALSRVASGLPVGARLRLVSDPLIVEP